MSDNRNEKGMIVLKCCEKAGCGVPDPGELAFDYVYEAYREGFEYARSRENYPINELIENQLPILNYEVATIWTQFQLYDERYSLGVRNLSWDTEANSSTFIKTFQYMLYQVTEDFVKLGERDAAMDSPTKVYGRRSFYGFYHIIFLLG